MIWRPRSPANRSRKHFEEAGVWKLAYTQKTSARASHFKKHFGFEITDVRLTIHSHHRAVSSARGHHHLLRRALSSHTERIRTRHARKRANHKHNLRRTKRNVDELRRLRHCIHAHVHSAHLRSDGGRRREVVRGCRLVDGNEPCAAYTSDCDFNGRRARTSIDSANGRCQSDHAARSANTGWTVAGLGDAALRSPAGPQAHDSIRGCHNLWQPNLAGNFSRLIEVKRDGVRF